VKILHTELKIHLRVKKNQQDFRNQLQRLLIKINSKRSRKQILKNQFRINTKKKEKVDIKQETEIKLRNLIMMIKKMMKKNKII
jgi:hypothetical protein